MDNLPFRQVWGDCCDENIAATCQIGSANHPSRFALYCSTLDENSASSSLKYHHHGMAGSFFAAVSSFFAAGSSFLQYFHSVHVMKVDVYYYLSLV
jgi:hypothetical protein